MIIEHEDELLLNIIYDDYAFYHDINKLDKYINETDFKKIVSIIYSFICDEVTRVEMIGIMNYFIRMSLKDAMRDKKVDIDYIIEHLNYINVDVTNELLLRKDTFNIVDIKLLLIQEFKQDYSNKIKKMDFNR